jgi:hypothetical protein
MLRCRSRSRYAEPAWIPGVIVQIAGFPEPIAARARWRVVRDIGGMGRPTSAYGPKTPAQSVLYQVVRDHFETVPR